MRTKKEYRKAEIPIIYQKSNMIINAIGKPQATSQKLMNMALSCVEIDPSHTPEEKNKLKEIQHRTKVDFSTGIVASFKQEDFTKLIPGRNNHWEETRDVLCSKSGLIHEYTMNIMGNDGKYTGAVALITGTYFDPDTKMIYVKFQDSDEMRSVFTDIKHTTRLKLDTITRLRGTYSIRIYEMLEMQVRLANYNAKREKKEPPKVYEYTIGTERLKWTVGFCYPKTDLPASEAEFIQNKVSECKTDYDFDKIYYNYKDKLAGTRWADFERVVLKKSIDELNKNTDMNGRRYSYEPCNDGGKKYKHVRFTVEDLSNNRPLALNTEIEVISDLDKEKAIECIRTILEKDKFFGKYFSDSDCYTLFKESNGDYERIEKAYDAFIQYAKDHLQTKGDKIKPLNMMISFIKKNAAQNQEISYEDYYAAHAGDMSIEEGVRKAKHIIKNANYQTANMSDEERTYVTNVKRYLCVDLSIKLADCDKFTIDDICNVLKRSDEYMQSLISSLKDEDNGQLRFDL